MSSNAVSAIFIVCLLLVIGGSLYQCQDQRAQYNTSMRYCIDHKGTWVPMTDTYKGSCVIK